MEIPTWLPKDERRLLAGYYQNIRKVEEEEVYRITELVRLLSHSHQRIIAYDEVQRQPDRHSPEFSLEATHAFTGRAKRVEHANTLPEKRGLIKLTEHQAEPSVFMIELTLHGFDLGRRYSSWWDRSGLRFQEYRNHWIWLVVSFLGGVLGGLLTNWLG